MKRHMRIVKNNMESSMEDIVIKVAFASDDLKYVNQHFGSAKSFAIYSVTMDTSELDEVIQFDSSKQDGNEDKLLAKMDAVKDCVAVYSQAIGASAVTKLKSIHVQPVKVTPDSRIKELIEILQDELYTGPVMWLAKAIESQSKIANSGARFDNYETEGWEE